MKVTLCVNDKIINKIWRKVIPEQEFYYINNYNDVPGGSIVIDNLRFSYFGANLFYPGIDGFDGFGWLRNSVNDNYFIVNRENKTLTLSGRRNSIVEFIGWLLPAEIKKCSVLKYTTSQPGWMWWDTLQFVRREKNRILQEYLV